MSSYRSRKSVSPIRRPLSGSNSNHTVVGSSGYTAGSNPYLTGSDFSTAGQSRSSPSRHNSSSSDVLRSSGSLKSSRPGAPGAGGPLFDDLSPRLYSSYASSHDYLSSSAHRTPSPSRRRTVTGVGSIGSPYRRSGSRERYHTVASEYPLKVTGSPRVSTLALETRPEMLSTSYNRYSNSTSRSPTPTSTSGYSSVRRSTSPGVQDILEVAGGGSDEYQKSRERLGSPAVASRPTTTAATVAAATVEPEYRSLTSRVLSKSDKKLHSDNYSDLDSSRKLVLTSNFIAGDLERKVERSASWMQEFEERMSDLKRNRSVKDKDKFSSSGSGEDSSAGNSMPPSPEPPTTRSDAYGVANSSRTVRDGALASSGAEKDIDRENARNFLTGVLKRQMPGIASSNSDINADLSGSVDSSGAQAHKRPPNEAVARPATPIVTVERFGATEATRAEASKAADKSIESEGGRVGSPSGQSSASTIVEDVEMSAGKERSPGGGRKRLKKEDVLRRGQGSIDRKESIVEVEVSDEVQLLEEVDRIKSRLAERLAASEEESASKSHEQFENEAIVTQGASFAEGHAEDTREGARGPPGAIKDDSEMDVLRSRKSGEKSPSAADESTRNVTSELAQDSKATGSGQPAAVPQASGPGSREKKDSQSLIPMVVVGIIVIIVAVVMFKRG